MSKKVFIIPGFREKPTTKGYNEVASIFRKKGCDVFIVDIEWNRKTMKEYVDQFLTIAKKEKGDVYILGFSFGAMIATIAARELNPKKLFLCSLSPYFKEDLTNIPFSWEKYLGKKRFAYFQGLSFTKFAHNLHCPTYIFLGEAEAKKFSPLEMRAKDAAKKIKKSTLIHIPGGKHDIAQPEYRKAVEIVIEQVM